MRMIRVSVRIHGSKRFAFKNSNANDSQLHWCPPCPAPSGGAPQRPEASTKAIYFRTTGIAKFEASLGSLGRVWGESGKFWAVGVMRGNCGRPAPNLPHHDERRSASAPRSKY